MAPPPPAEASEKKPPVSMARATFTVQSRLLDLPRCSERQLLAAGSLLSIRDFDDVVTERSLSRLCGSPLCPNVLPPSPSRRPRYRIALREHRVYDLRDASRFCSDSCHVASKAFSGTLSPERSSISASRIAETLRLFEEDDSPPLAHSALLSQLTIRENCTESGVGMNMEHWIGPSNAIEGYVPRDKRQQGTEAKPKVKSVRNYEQFKSEIIVDSVLSDVLEKVKSCSILPPRDEEDVAGAVEKMRSCSLSSPMDANSVEADMLKDRGRSNIAVQVEERKSSLKKPGPKTAKGGVKWAAKEQINVSNTKNIKYRLKEGLPSESDIDDERSLRVASAQACAEALMQASEAAASGGCEVEDAVNEAGIMPSSQEEEMDTDTEDEVLAYERSCQKWLRKPMLLDTDAFDVEDYWHDAAPEGFNLTLSTFATMWKTLFEWITRSSVAFIYGKSGNSEDEFSVVDGREYPQKVTLSDGRSSEIKITLSGCIARALPQVVSHLMIPLPISTMEKEIGRLLETMTFIEAIPSFKTKEWHIIVLLFLDAISVSRIPALYTHLANKNVLLEKVFDAAHIRRDEYSSMKDLMIPLGRSPQFSVQSGV